MHASLALGFVWGKRETVGAAAEGAHAEAYVSGSHLFCRIRELLTPYSEALNNLESVAIASMVVSYCVFSTCGKRYGMCGTSAKKQ